MDDDILWRGICEQHIGQKFLKCGWGLSISEKNRTYPLLSDSIEHFFDTSRNQGTQSCLASDDGTIKLWDLDLWTCVWQLTGHVGQVQSLKLLLAVDCDDGSWITGERRCAEWTIQSLQLTSRALEYSFLIFSVPIISGGNLRPWLCASTKVNSYLG
jgi:hypothetical protein